MNHFNPCNTAGPLPACPENVADLLNTSADAQRQRVLALLLERPRSTFELRDDHNVMMPGARIKELKDIGHDIATMRRHLPDREGRIHPRVAVYVLINLANASEVPV